MNMVPTFEGINTQKLKFIKELYMSKTQHCKNRKHKEVTLYKINALIS